MVSEELNQKLQQLADETLNSDSTPVDYKNCLSLINELMVNNFDCGQNVTELLHARSNCIDRLLSFLWQQHIDQFKDDLSLVAVGGYGRGELHPFSDIDLLILTPAIKSGYEANIQTFITFLWDCGLDIGHAVRSVKECVSQAKNDITIATNLMESRLLAGDDGLLTQMKSLTGPKKIWPNKEFFAAKCQEQKTRHLKFQKTSYALEPNLKKSPGTLRDIQLIGWVAKRHFDVDSLDQLVELNFLTQAEFKTLEQCQDFLWKVRFALHIVANRAEDRLLFDHQKPVAEMLCFEDGEHLNDVELLMRQYYRVVKTIRELNDMLLQHFSESILGNDKDHRITELDSDFQIHGSQIEICNLEVFKNNPSCLLRLFIYLADNPSLEGVRAPTLRQIIIDRELVNSDEFRNNTENKHLFISLFKHPNGMGRAFSLMKRYGVLRAYLPAYDQILGQMQYDLFHIYTVDEHTLFVVGNLARFSDELSREEFPLCCKVIKNIPKLELLYLSGLFHDIGKGQGGNHSIIGADIAKNFCAEHGLSKSDGELVTWLVNNHLLMSMTAQRKDITDPEVIHQFASIVNSTNKLNYLYLLTVADIRSTNPSLWNNWKDSLLKNLYQLTYIALTRGLENPRNAAEAIDDVKAKIMDIMKQRRIVTTNIEKIWSQFKDDYFLRNTPERIAWQIRRIIHNNKPGPVISLYRYPDSGATEVFAYMPKHPQYFTLITTLLAEKNLSIQDASLHSTYHDYTLGSFVILEADGTPISSDRRIQSIKKMLRKHLNNPSSKHRQLKKSIPHRNKHFDIQTEIKFSTSENGKRSLMELVALDRPGLLAQIGKALYDLSIEIHSAKVVTLGEKVEDIFSLTDIEECLLSDEIEVELKALILKYLDE